MKYFSFVLLGLLLTSLPLAAQTPPASNAPTAITPNSSAPSTTNTPVAAAPATPSAAPGTSLVDNSSFESGTTGWAFFVPADSKAAFCRFTVSFDNPHSGTACAELQSTEFARYGLSCPKLTVAPGDHYHVSYWVRGGAGAEFKPATAGIVLRLGMKAGDTANPTGDYYSGLDGNAAVGKTIAVPPTLPAIPTQWTQVQSDIVIPPGVTTMAINLFIWQGKGPFFVDDFEITRTGP